MFGGFRPGQRETSRTSIETEVKITLQHAAWALCAMLIIAVVLRFAVIFPIARALVSREILAAKTANWWACFIADMLFYSALLVPLAALSVSFVTQVYDRNWPPPRQALPADDGPAAPGILRRLSGWHDTVSEPEIFETYDAPQQTDDPEQHEINANITMTQRTSNIGAKTLRGRMRLNLAQWRALRALFKQKQDVSLRNLEKYTPLDRDGAQLVNDECIKHAHFFTSGKWGRLVPLPEFRQWVIDGGFEIDSALAFPTLKSVRNP